MPPITNNILLKALAPVQPGGALGNVGKPVPRSAYVAPAVTAPAVTSPPVNGPVRTSPDYAFKSLTLTNNNASPITGILAVSLGPNLLQIPFTLLQLGTPGNAVSFPTSGTEFYIYQTNGTVTVRPDISAEGDYVQGTGVEWNWNGTQWLAKFIDKRVILTSNPPGAYVPIQDAPTIPLAFVFQGGTIASNTTVDIPGTANGSALRQSIIIRNVDENAPLQVLDKNGHVLTTLEVGDPPWELVTSGDVKVRNNTGNAMTSPEVVENYYTS